MKENLIIASRANQPYNANNMRKVVLFIGFLFVISSLLAVVYNFGLDNRSLTIEDGFLDLSETPYDKLQPVLLKGNWHFYPESLPDPEAPAPTAQTITVPSSWTASINDTEKRTAPNYAAYRLRIKVPEPGYYSIALDNVYTAYRIIVNGCEISEIGTFSTEPEKSVPRFKDSIVTFYAESETAEILIYISNFIHPKSGLVTVPILGTPDSIFQLITMSHGISLMLTAVLLLSALFLLFFYTRENSDAGILYIVLMSTSLAIKTFATSTMMITFFPSIPTGIILKIEYITIASGFAGFYLYFRHSFPLIVHKLIIDVSLIITLLFGLLVLITPIRIYNILLIPFSIVMGICMVIITGSMIIDWIRKKTLPSIILFGIFIALLAAINQFVYYFFDVSNLFTAELSALGITFFIIVHFYDFSSQFLKALRISRETSLELEKKVEIRTRELNELNRKLQVAASRDELTALWNRNELYRRIEQETLRYNRYYTSNSQYFSVLYIDLDNFKHFNDTYSHEVGDQVLRFFAKSIQDVNEDNHLLFRVGGDEFVMFMEKTGRSEAAAFSRRLLGTLLSSRGKLEKELQATVSSQMQLDSKTTFACSIGIAVHEEGLINIEQLIQQADIALNAAKRQGKNGYAFFTESPA
jgi:diguanylate cyclase (GGDEF)-like protein